MPCMDKLRSTEQGSAGMKYDPGSIDREEYYYAYGEFMHNCLLGLGLRYYI